MPELPDVETFKRYLDATSLHQRIRQVHVQQPRVLKNATPQALGRILNGHSFEQSRRYGKYLFIRLDDGRWLLLHFGMTGRLEYFKEPKEPPKHTDVLFDFENGSHLAYVAPRKLGKVTPLDDPEQFLHDQKLGPDALQLSYTDFKNIVGKRRGSVKCMLMNQELMAGIGNNYSDEIMFQAGLHPKAAADKLDEDGLHKLFDAMRHVLNTAIKTEADPSKLPGDFLLPQRNKGGHCPKCEGNVQHVSACGRTAWYCPKCQGGD